METDRVHVTATADPEDPVETDPEAADRGWDGAAEGRPGQHHRRTPARRALALCLVGLVVLAAAVGVGVGAHNHLRHTRSSLESTRAQLHRTLARLASAHRELDAATEQSAAAGRDLATASAQLASDQAELSKAQEDVFAKGVSISELDTCLAGVEAALNQISVGDQTGAASTLSGVAANCRAAEPAA